MKDIIVSARRIKMEVIWLIASFIIANLFNAGAIWYYHAPAKELITSFFYVLIFTVFIYALTVVVRLIIAGIKNLLKL